MQKSLTKAKVLDDLTARRRQRAAERAAYRALVCAILDEPERPRRDRLGPLLACRRWRQQPQQSGARAVPPHVTARTRRPPEAA